MACLDLGGFRARGREDATLVSQPDKPVLVIGGTRATGLHTVQALLRRQIPVRVLARNPTAAAETLGREVQIARGDLRDRASLIAAFDGVSHLVFTAGARSGRFARESLVKATEYDGVLNTIAAAREKEFRGRFVYMTSIGVRRASPWNVALNIWKGNTIRWRRRAEDAIRASGLDYTIVRAAFLLNRPANQHGVLVAQKESALTLHEFIGRADVAEVLVEAVYHPAAQRSTFEVRWNRGPRPPSWPELLRDLKPDSARTDIASDA